MSDSFVSAVAARSADVVWHWESEASDMQTLTAGFDVQAQGMPLLLRRVLIGNAPPSTILVHEFIRALRVGSEQDLAKVYDALRRPVRELLYRQEKCLGTDACKALRTAVDAGATQGRDSVDSLAEIQLDLTLDELRQRIGSHGLDALRELPARFARCRSSSADDLVIQRAFARRYSVSGRPFFTFHMDTAAMTANVALADDALHDGGRLLALVGADGLRSIERREGEATVHPSSLLHGVSMMRGAGVRYSLIVFYRSREAEEAERREWHDDSRALRAAVLNGVDVDRGMIRNIMETHRIRSSWWGSSTGSGDADGG